MTSGVPSICVHRASSAPIISRTSWGEQASVRLSGEQTGSNLAILDYRAPAGFGPVKHLHHREDEVFELTEGQAVVWTEERSFVVAPGDVVFLPRNVAHTWRAYGPDPIRLTVTVTPSGFEQFFPSIELRGLQITDTADLTTVCKEAGIVVTGPPLTDEEVQQIIEASAA